MPHRNEPTKNTTKKTTSAKSAPQQEESRLSHITNELRDRAHNAGEEVRKYVTSAVGDVDTFKKDVGKNIKNAEKNIRKNIRKEPVKATLIALGAGFLVGLFTRK